MVCTPKPMSFKPMRIKRTGVNLPDNIRKVEDKGGTAASTLLRRLARRTPEILDRWKNNEFPSVRAAAIEAGIVKVKTFALMVEES